MRNWMYDPSCERSRPGAPGGARLVSVFRVSVVLASVVVASVVVASVGVVPAALAQFRQYTPPADVGGSATSRQQQLEEQMAEARWRLGPIRLEPWLGIRNVQYVDNLFAAREGDPAEDVSDLTASAGLGLTAYLPVGSKVIWTAQAAPEYVWWRDQDERNQLAGRLESGVFADFNRLRLEVLAGRQERQGRFTSEALQLGVLRQDRVEANLELRLAGGLWVFGGGSFTELEDQTGAERDPRVIDFRRLDREEEIRRAGLAYVFPNEVRIAVGLEDTETDLAAGARPLSSEGTSPILEIRAPGSRMDLQLDLARRDLDPVPGSRFAGFDETAGHLRIGWRPGWRFRFRLHARNEPVLSLEDSYSHFTERRVGLTISAPFFEDRLRLTLYGEEGENEYRAIAPGVAARTDDAVAWGADLTLAVAGPFSFTTGFENLELDSNLPGFDRKVNSFTASLGLQVGRGLMWR